MSATGTAERQSEAALAFALIERQGKLEKSIKTIEKHARFQVSENIFFDFGFEAAACPKFIDKIRIGQKPHIQNHVGIVGNAKFVSERCKKQRHSAGLRSLAKVLLDLPF